MEATKALRRSNGGQDPVICVIWLRPTACAARFRSMVRRLRAAHRSTTVACVVALSVAVSLSAASLASAGGTASVTSGLPVPPPSSLPAVSVPSLPVLPTSTPSVPVSVPSGSAPSVSVPAVPGVTVPSAVSTVPVPRSAAARLPFRGSPPRTCPHPRSGRSCRRPGSPACSGGSPVGASRQVSGGAVPARCWASGSTRPPSRPRASRRRGRELPSRM